MAAKKKRPKVQWFTIDVAPYSKQIFVCTGFTSHAQVMKRLPKKAPKWFVDFVKDHREGIEKDLEEDSGVKGAIFFEKKHGAALIMLQPYFDAWEYWETLIHELSHYLDHLGEDVGLTFDESEARAYLIEHLFHKIRRTLMGYIRPYRP